MNGDSQPVPEDLSALEHAKPLTFALAKAFAEGARKVCFSQRWGKKTDGKPVLAMQVDILGGGLWEEINATLNSIDWVEEEVPIEEAFKQRKPVCILLDKSRFEIMRAKGKFDFIDATLSNQYKQESPDSPGPA